VILATNGNAEYHRRHRRRHRYIRHYHHVSFSMSLFVLIVLYTCCVIVRCVVFLFLLCIYVLCNYRVPVVVFCVDACEEKN